MTTIYTVNNKVLKNAATDKWLTKKEAGPGPGPGPGPVDPYNPLGLPPFTIRCKFTSGYTPTMGDSQTLVDSGENIWDITKNSTDWSLLFLTESDWEQPWLQSVLGANTTGVTAMNSMFAGCVNFTSVALFDTSSVTDASDMFNNCSISTVPLFDTGSCTDMYNMFQDCYNLTHIPLFDTSSAQDVNCMFKTCYNVQTGAFELYQQMSTQANPPGNHPQTFTDCGNSENIPDDWKEPDDDGGDDEEEDYGDDEE